MARFGMALLVVLALVACGSSVDGSERPCLAARSTLLENIATGLTVSGDGGLANGYRVDLPNEVAGWTQLIAAEITGPGMGGASTVGLWAANDDATFLMAVDGIAWEFSDWGTAANPGSPMDDARQSVRFTDEAKHVTNCAEDAAG